MTDTERSVRGPAVSRGAALLSEGQCPNDHGPLEQREGWGFCAGCGHLWRIRGEAMEMAVEITADFGDRP